MMKVMKNRITETAYCEYHRVKALESNTDHEEVFMDAFYRWNGSDCSFKGLLELLLTYNEGETNT